MGPGMGRCSKAGCCIFSVGLRRDRKEEESRRTGLYLIFSLKNESNEIQPDSKNFKQQREEALKSTAMQKVGSLEKSS